MKDASFHIIGDIALVKFKKDTKSSEKNAFAAALVKKMKRIKSVCELQEISGELRRPVLKKLVGEETTTVHREHGISYKIDLAELMFSKGNVAERKRLIPTVKDNEKILDMFAGIGYFCLGIAKMHPSAEIIACEKNSVAFRFLNENIELNKIANIITMNEDCRKLEFENCFDRIIMGYFPRTETFLDNALKMIKPGGTIHLHNIYNEKELWSRPIEQIRSACEKRKMEFNILEERKVKSYAPHVYHVVVDFSIDE